MCHFMVLLHLKACLEIVLKMLAAAMHNQVYKQERVPYGDQTEFVFY